MSERRRSRLVSAGPRARRVHLGGSRLVSAGPRARRIKLGGALLTRYNKGGELRPRSSAQYPSSSLYGVEGGARRVRRARGGTGFINSGGSTIYKGRLDVGHIMGAGKITKGFRPNRSSRRNLVLADKDEGYPQSLANWVNFCARVRAQHPNKSFNSTELSAMYHSRRGGRSAH